MESCDGKQRSKQIVAEPNLQSVPAGNNDFNHWSQQVQEALGSLKGQGSAKLADQYLFECVRVSFPVFVQQVLALCLGLHSSPR